MLNAICNTLCVLAGITLVVLFKLVWDYQTIGYGLNPFVAITLAGITLSLLVPLFKLPHS